jgi:hypothetical protein
MSQDGLSTKSLVLEVPLLNYSMAKEFAVKLGHIHENPVRRGGFSCGLRYRRRNPDGLEGWWNPGLTSKSRTRTGAPKHVARPKKPPSE